MFKNVSYGQLAITNVPGLKSRLLAAAASRGQPSTRMVGEALELNEIDYVELVREQQRIVSRFTYRESLESYRARPGEPA